MLATVRTLQSQLKKLSEPLLNATLAGLVDLCYTMRGDQVDEVKRWSKASGDDFAKLAHYIGRMGATRSSVLDITTTVTKVPSLRNITDIHVIKAPEPRSVAIDKDKISPYKIVWAICKDTTSQNPLQIQSVLHSIVSLDHPSNHEIQVSLGNQKTIITRVHAEVQIVDRFSRD